MANSTDFFKAVLKGIGAPQTKQNIQFLNMWANREGVPQSIDQFNYLGTTKKIGNSYGTNGPGVQSYQSFQDGVQANIMMFLQANFSTIRSALRSGNPYRFKNNPGIQREFLSWSGGGYSWPEAGSSSSLPAASGAASEQSAAPNQSGAPPGTSPPSVPQPLNERPYQPNTNPFLTQTVPITPNQPLPDAPPEFRPAQFTPAGFTPAVDTTDYAQAAQMWQQIASQPLSSPDSQSYLQAYQVAAGLA